MYNVALWITAEYARSRQRKDDMQSSRVRSRAVASAVAFAVLIVTSWCGTNRGGQVRAQGVDGAAQLVYDMAPVKPVRAAFCPLSAEIPPGYDQQKLVGSLPERDAVTLAFFTYGDANSRRLPSPWSAILCGDCSSTGIAIRCFRPRRKCMATRPMGGRPIWTQNSCLGTNQYAHEQRRVEIRLDEPPGYSKPRHSDACAAKSC